MLRLALVVVVVLALPGTTASARVRAPAAPAATAPSATFFITGRGWGHGVGLSQWGAYGFAQRGTSYDAILAHYYRGTQLGRAPVARVRVLLGEGKKSVTIRSASAFRVRDGAGAVHELEAGAYTFGPALKLKVRADEEPVTLQAPLLFSPGASPLEYVRPYRGQIQLNLGSNRLQVVNNVGLEPYLYGVVPREVPSTWPAEALKAQAVVARSYALAVRKTGAYDLYPDTRSQVYGGVPAEKPSTNAAVDATAGQVLLYAGKVATTFFFSTSGGRTANVGDVWSGDPLPYLVSVPDPYDNASPHHTWGPVLLPHAKLARTFKLPGAVVDVRTDVNPSQRVDTVTFVTARGDELSFRGTDVRTRLGLRSTWFRMGLLSLDRPAAPIEYGAQVRLNGRVRGAANAVLEQRAGPIWEPASRLKPAADGSITAAVRPLTSTDYRLAVSSTVAGAPVRVSVAPRVRFHPVTEQTSLRGVVRPVLPGVTVQIQRLVGSAWRTVATATLDEAGQFTASLRLTPGSYRARVAPGRGFVPGFSPTLKVVG